MRFFSSDANRSGDEIALLAPDAVHISRVLRMKAGDAVVICDDVGFEHDCVLVSVSKDRVLARIVQSRPYSTEPSVGVTVFAALSKGERFDFLIQKCVEVGASAIVPFISEHCVARPDERDYERKQARYARIALDMLPSYRGYNPQAQGSPAPKRCKALWMNYLAESRWGDTLRVYGEETAQGFILQGETAAGPSFACRGEYA